MFYCALCVVIGGVIYGQNVKVLTYNIRLDLPSDGINQWSNRKFFLTGQIQFYEPDIFGIQEALPNQVIDIVTALSEYKHVGIGREGIEKGESSSIFYKKDKFKVVSSNTFWLSKTPNLVSIGWDAAYIRICTYALFKDLKSKKLFWVFNTHLDHIGVNAKKNGIELILAEMERLNHQKYPIVLMGDFNSEPNSEPINIVKKSMYNSSEISLEKPFGPFGTFNNFEYMEPVTKLIDYIFINKGNSFKVKKYGVLTDAKDLKYPSDHFPVFVEFYDNTK